MGRRHGGLSPHAGVLVLEFIRSLPDATLPDATLPDATLPDATLQ